MSSVVDLLGTWIVTFAIHSTLVLACAFALSRACGMRALGVQEHALRLAPWLALLSASLQCAVFGSPWSVPGGEPLPLDATSAAGAEPALFEVEPGELVLAAASVSPWRWQPFVVGVAVLCAAGGSYWLFATALRLRRVLAGRAPEVDARVLSIAATAATAAGLRHSPHVSRSPRVVAPIAFGFLRPEICLPANAAALDAPSLRAMLAHEVAHLRAADPAWMWGAAWLQAMFPWQLWLWPVRSQWRHLVELRSDAEASRHAGATAVARCLLDVASWLQSKGPTPLVALGMASRPSALKERIDAALRGEPFALPSRRRALAGASTVLGALTFAAPGVVPSVEPGSPRIAESPAEAAATESAPLTTSGSAVAALLDQVSREREQLVAEAAHLLQSNASSSPEMRHLRAVLEERLAGLDQLHARLSARVRDRFPETR